MRRAIGVAIFVNLLASAWYIPYIFTKVGKLPPWTDLGIIATLLVYAVLSVFIGVGLITYKCK